MKRKITALALVLLLLVVPHTAMAATIMYNKFYIAQLDQYRVDYSYPTGSAKTNLHFVTNTGTHYDLNFNGTPTGHMYLTCNGTYTINFYDASDSLVGYFDNILTNEIVDPTCNSYENQTGQNDLNATQHDNGDGTYKIDWSHAVGGTHTKVLKNGQEVSYTNGTSYTGQPGSYTLLDFDNEGKITGISDLTVPDGTISGGTSGNGEAGSGGGDGGNGGGSCNGCEMLEQMLACPGWSQYMGDLTGAIKDALPPPPNWDDIADKIGRATVNHLSDYLGNVPDAPSQSQIDNATQSPLPDVDATDPDASNLVPTMPTDFDEPIPFNIDNGPEIEVKDESKPFSIFDPLSDMQIDRPGTPVFPGDPRNDSGGIKSPDQAETGGPAIPTVNPTAPPIPSGGGNDVPPAEMPVPSGGGSDIPPAEMPIPGQSTSTTPTPRVDDVTIPIPRGGVQ